MSLVPFFAPQSYSLSLHRERPKSTLRISASTRGSRPSKTHDRRRGVDRVPIEKSRSNRRATSGRRTAGFVNAPKASAVITSLQSSCNTSRISVAGKTCRKCECDAA